MKLVKRAQLDKLIRHFWLSPDCRFVPVKNHPSYFSTIFKGDLSNANYWPAYKLGWVRCIIYDNEELAYEGNPNSKQMQELQNQAIERKVELVKGKPL